jgi:type II secretory pathway component PulM
MKSILAKIGRWFAAQLDEAFGPLLRRAGGRLAPLTAQVRTRYQRLEPRERTLLQIAGAVFAIFIAYNFIYLPFQDWQQSLQTALETRRGELTQVHHLVDVYLQRKAQLQTAEKSTVPIGKDFSLFSVIETSLTQSIGHDKIGSITPGADRKLSDGFTQYSVAVKLQSVNLAQIVDGLYGVRSLRAPVAVSNLHITRRTQDPHTYDVDMTCIALAKSP